MGGAGLAVGVRAVIEIHQIDGVLSEDECAQLIGLMLPYLRPSTITTPNEPDRYFRTSKTCDLSLLDAPIVRAVDDRLCRLVWIPAALGEPIQGQYYGPGDEFKAHTDYFKAADLEQHMTPAWGQRTWTVMVYLNEPRVGGATAFPRVGQAYTPKPGQALIWNNLLSTGQANIDTLHAGEPVVEGFKAVITKWFRVPRVQCAA